MASARRPAAARRVPASSPSCAVAPSTRPSSVRSMKARSRWSPTRASLRRSARATSPAGHAGQPAALGNQPVGGLLQERVSELAPAGDRWLDQLALLETVELVPDRSARERLDRGLREVPSGDGGDAHHLALGFGERLDPRRQQHLDRTGQEDGCVVVAHQRRQVLGEERIALGRGDDRARPGQLQAPGWRGAGGCASARCRGARGRPRSCSRPRPNRAAARRTPVWRCRRRAALHAGRERAAARRRPAADRRPSAHPRARSQPAGRGPSSRSGA